MAKNQDNRSNNNKGETKQTVHKGGPNKSNRETGGSKRHERDDSNGGADRNTTKKGANAV